MAQTDAMHEPEQIGGGVTVEQIDRTRDTGDAVFTAESETARATFIFPSTRKHDMIIHTVRSSESGGMSDLLDAVCQEYECKLLRFSTPLNDTLFQKLNGFEYVEEPITDGPMAGETWECLDGEWQIDE